MQKEYLKFYWPLALTGLVLLLSRQFQNGVLARYPDAVRELAIYAFASGVFFILNAALVFVPQMANVLARSPRAHRVCLRFTLAACLLLSVPLVLLAFSPAGEALLAWIYGIEGATLQAVVKYLRYLLPLILIHGLRQYYTGMLVQAKRTGTVTILNVVYVAAVIGLLILGLTRRWQPVTTLALAQVVASAIYLVLAFCLYVALYRFPAARDRRKLTYREALSFFWPVATTSTMFALSRPIIYAFVARTPSSLTGVAALRVGFDFAMIFHSPLNQLRHFFVTFRRDDPAGKRKFVAWVTLGLTVLMLAVAATPVSGLVFRGLLNVHGEVLHMARHVLLILCLMPLIVTVRNAFHGGLMNRRRTNGMAVGGICRLLAIYAACWVLHAAGWLNHAAAAGVLLLGFAAETVVAAISVRLLPAETLEAVEALAFDPDSDG